MRIFLAKHQKLILQCYPPGKGVDKKPNPSELSYLMYYASTRRVKLEKVAIFLAKLTRSDTNHNRDGNLQVTLAILTALIQKCSDDLNVFATLVCNILLSILDKKDLALSKNVLNTYGEFCSKLDSALFPGDKDFVQRFTALSQRLIDTDSIEARANASNRLEWKMIALVASRYLSHCFGHINGKKLLDMSLPLLFRTVYENTSQVNLLSRLKSSVSGDVDSRRLSRVALIKPPIEGESVTDIDITEEVLRGLKAIFNTSLTAQIVESTQALVKYNFSHKIEQNLGITLLEMCTLWIPVQLRFITLGSLLGELTSLSRLPIGSAQDYNIQVQYANYVSGLISSEVNMIGLSISDIIQQILELQSNLLLHQYDFFNAENTKKLSMIYTNCICNLSTHIYYYDQVPDSIQEILTKVDSVLEFSFVNDETTGKINADRIHELILTLLEDVSVIFSLLRKKTSSISRNYVKLEHWDVSLALISPESEFDKDKKASLSIAQFNSIQRKYLRVFCDFLLNELTSSYPSPTASEDFLDKMSNKKRDDEFKKISEEFKDYSKPDINQYISNTDNFITHFLIYVDKFFTHRQFPNIDNVFLLNEILKKMISILGINFIVNFIPFFYHWVLPLNKQTEFSQNSLFKDTFAYTIMYHSLKGLDEKYADLDNYVTSSKFFTTLLNEIEYRKSHRLWINGIDSDPSDEEISTNSNTYNGGYTDLTKFNLTKKNMQQFASGNEFLSSWIHPGRPLLLDGKPEQEPKKEPSKQEDAIPNGNEEEDVPDPSPNLDMHFDSCSDDSYVVDHRNHSTSGFGLGTANDISSIHSEIVSHNQGRGNGNLNDPTSGSIYTAEGRNYMSPRVSDLKDVMLEHRGSIKKPKFLSPTNWSPANESVLCKQMINSDVTSILGDLDSDDDNEIIV